MTPRTLALLVPAVAACASAPPPQVAQAPQALVAPAPAGQAAAEPAAPATATPPPAPEPPRSEAAAPARVVPPAPAGLAAGLLAEHNRYRAQHCAPPLAWSAQLAAGAQRWADSLRDHGCAFEHSRSEYGENLASGTSGTLDAAAVVAMWYDEISAYDFKNGGFSMDTGHFTQVVWRGTTRLGCAKATCRGPDSMDLFVCNYDPPGNFEDAYRENVRPKGCR